MDTILSSNNRNILSFTQFDVQTMKRLLDRTNHYRAGLEQDSLRYRGVHLGRIALMLFRQHSTRTDLTMVIAARRLGIGQDVKDYLRSWGTTFREEVDMRSQFQRGQIWYCTRQQDDQLNRKQGEVTEIEAAIDDMPQAAYWLESAYGVPAGMAFCDWSLRRL